MRHLPDDLDLDIPKSWDATTKEEAKETQLGPNSDQIALGWLHNFNVPELLEYSQYALDHNPDLLSSATQLKSAIEQVTVDASALWPNVSAGAQKTRTDTEINGVSVETSRVVGSLNVDWEADIWGKLTERKRFAAYSAKAQENLYHSAEFSLVANVSRAWFNMIANRLLVELAEKRLDSFQSTADLIDENYQRGLRSALDVYLSRTDVQIQRAALADQRFRYLQSVRTFETLLGKYPETDLAVSAPLPDLAQLSPAVMTGLPAELIERRPDIMASKWQYQAQIAAAKAARRDRFPTLAFSGSISDSRDHFSELFDGDNLVTTLVSGVTQPLFFAGALRSRENQALYQAENSYAQLLRTSLNAFEEVENALSQENFLYEQHTAFKNAVEFAQGGLDLALDRYQSGIENYTTVLESQRRLFGSLREEINLRNALLQNRISIYLALGGDFATETDRESMRELPNVINRNNKDHESPQ